MELIKWKSAKCIVIFYWEYFHVLSPVLPLDELPDTVEDFDEEQLGGWFYQIVEYGPHKRTYNIDKLVNALVGRWILYLEHH